MARTDGEKITALETGMTDVNRRLTEIEDSVKGLHDKLDDFKELLSENYLPVRTFEEYKSAQKEKEKNRWLEIVISVLVTAIIGGLVAFFLRGF